MKDREEFYSFLEFASVEGDIEAKTMNLMNDPAARQKLADLLVECELMSRADAKWLIANDDQLREFMNQMQHDLRDPKP
jgi:hypothetical protein